MSDARWFEADLDVRAAVDHFEKSIRLHEKGRFDDPGLEGYQAEMALMHALQSAPRISKERNIGPTLAGKA